MNMQQSGPRLSSQRDPAILSPSLISLTVFLWERKAPVNRKVQESELRGRMNMAESGPRLSSQRDPAILSPSLISLTVFLWT